MKVGVKLKVSTDKSLFKGRLLVSDNSDEISDYNSAVKQKKVSTEDSFETADSDFSVSDVTNKLRFFATDTVSGKMINRRVYSNDSVQSSVKNSGWINPYKKRIIKNHDSYGDYTVLGLVQDSHFVDLQGSNHFSSDASRPLPSNVRNYVIQDNKIGEGASVIELLPNSKFIDGLCDFENTIFSQSSAYEKALCSICGKDLFGDDCCDHWPGNKYSVPVAPNSDQYTNELCYPIMVGDRMPCEFSSVVTPANDSSILYIMDIETGECFKADSIKDFREFFSKYSVSCSPPSSDSSKEKNVVKDSFTNEFNKYKKLGGSEQAPPSTVKEDNAEQPEGEKKMLTDKQKENVIRTVKLSIKDATVQEKIMPKIESMINKDGANDETVELVLDFIELTASNLVDTSAEKETEESSESNDGEGEGENTEAEAPTSEDVTKQIQELRDSVEKIMKIVSDPSTSTDDTEKDEVPDPKSEDLKKEAEIKTTDSGFKNYNFN